MSQPPPPPNQPPQQGGFGPPQDPPPQQPPPPPGYGYPQAPPVPPVPQAPQAPPPPPGYGYPQAPPAPQGAPQTPPPPGYGYPGQQPNPYGPPQPPYGQQPNPYGQQPGHGYPGHPTAPMQPQAGKPGGGGRLNAPLLIIVAAVVAIGLIIGGGVWYSSTSGKDDGAKTSGGADGSGGTDGGKDSKGNKGGTTSGGTEKVPADPAAKLLFQVPSPPVKDKDDNYVVSGSWLTDTVYAKSGIAEITGYDRDKGGKLWTIKLPGPVCQSSDHVTADGRTAVAFQPKMPPKNSSAGCSQVAAIDLNKGTKLWTKTANSGDQLINWNNITVGGNTVAVGSTSGGAAFDISTGKALWTPKQTDTCYDAGYGGGTKLVAVRKCGSYDSPVLHIQNIDPASGKVIAEYKMTQGIEYAAVVSTDPLVVAADVGDSAGDGSGISDFFSIDNRTGALRAHISAPGKTYAARCDDIDQLDHCSGLAVGNDRLYIATEEHDGSGGSYSRTNEIVSFDLATGKETGQRADAGNGYTIAPLRMDGENVLAYKSPPYDKGGQIVSVDGGTFKQTKLLENPKTDAESTMSPQYSEILYGQGHLYLAEVYADKASSASDKKYLAIAFGTGG
ncbi:PQQ-binding-like beta-propeller repeat protein [Streptomyces sp. NPDC005423]|uniref:outer membrane protein assembly factor BamB family protein n=1 Tax=Streptomyces sp. NPDC005423 TaxID=3155343 RepID=UPI00339EB769